MKLSGVKKAVQSYASFQYVSTDLGVNSEKLHFHFTGQIDYGLEVVLKLEKTEYLIFVYLNSAKSKTIQVIILNQFPLYVTLSSLSIVSLQHGFRHNFHVP